MEESLLIEKCLAGEPEALTFFRSNYLAPVRPVLIQRGASPNLADDILAGVWTDCVVGRDTIPPLLAKYRGRSSLRNWVFRISLNRYIDSRRRSARADYLQLSPTEPIPEDHLAETHAMAPHQAETALIRILHSSLKTAFASSPPEDLLKLRLVFLHDLTHREVARMWGCHEATVARDLDRALHHIADLTLREVARHDARLQLTWPDFLLLCQTEELDFL